MRLVEFEATYPVGKWMINPEYVQALKVGQTSGDTRIVLGAGENGISVKLPIERVAELLTQENPVEVVAEPEAIVLRCRNCGFSGARHRANWAGGLNCPSVLGQDQTFWYPMVDTET